VGLLSESGNAKQIHQVGGREDAALWYVVRIAAFCLFAANPLQGRFKSRPWLNGVIACAAFLLSDMMRLNEIFAGPALGNAFTLVSSGLLLSLLVGIGASLWTDASTFLAKRAAQLGACS
jgi:hypothetical protein